MTEAISPSRHGDELLLNALLGRHGSAGPYDAYRRLRETAPVHVSATGVVVLSRFRDCDQVLRDRRLGKVDESLGFGLTDVSTADRRLALTRFRRTMLFRNPPDHERLRRLVADVFTHRHVQELRGSIVAAIEGILDGLAARSTADLITDLALPLPVTVIGNLLGLPSEDRDTAAPLVRELVGPLEPAADAAAIHRAARAEDWLAQYFADLIAAKRSRPGDDLLSRLAHARGDDTLDDDECIGTAILLFAAGFETTTNLIGNGLAALFEHPDEMARFRSTPELAQPAVEELLRYDAPVQTNARTALQPVTVGDETVEPGQVVVTLLGAANRDPERFPDPDRLDLSRAEAAPLSFGGGIHFCLGAPLARLEGAELFPRLLTRFPKLALADDPVWRPGLTFRGLSSLPVRMS